MPKHKETIPDEYSDAFMIEELRKTVDSSDVFSATREWSLANLRRSVPSRGDCFDRKGVLVFDLDDVEVLSVCVSDLPVTIGRGERVDCRLNYEGISRVHCRLERVGSLVRLCDAGSKNGTLVNGNQVRSEDLCDGDIIQLGQASLRLRRA